MLFSTTRPIDLLIGASCLLPSRPAALVCATTALPASRWEPTIEANLTPAEARVLELVLAGLANKEIASELNRAEATIKNQVASILRKHGVPSRARLMAVLR